MLRFLTAFLALGAIVGTASGARAQSKNAIGVMFVTPSLLGFDWDVSNKVAIRPDFSFTRNSSGEFTSWTVAVGVSSPIYFRRWTDLSVYASPRISHSLNRGSPSATTTSSSVGGSLGAQYNLAARFSIFAEGGVAYSHVRRSIVGVASTTDTLSNRTALGAILYF